MQQTIPPQESKDVSETPTPRPFPAGLSATDRVVLFDGVCVFCSAWVDFIIARDPHAKLRLCSIQSDPGREILEWSGLNPDDCDTMVFFEGGKSYIKSTAGLRVLRYLSGLWPVLSILRFLAPAFIRDFVYDRLAKNRYKLFGKQDACMIPTPDDRKRFLM